MLLVISHHPSPRCHAVRHRRFCSHVGDRFKKTRIHCPSASHPAVASDGGALWAKVGGALSVAEGVLIAENQVTSRLFLCNSYQHDFVSHPNPKLCRQGWMPDDNDNPNPPPKEKALITPEQSESGAADVRRRFYQAFCARIHRYAISWLCSVWRSIAVSWITMPASLINCCTVTGS